MGQSTPTTTMALDTFERRYAEFRAELPRAEQPMFDDLVERARRHSNALNRRPHMDFERPVLLAMLLGCVQKERETGQEIAALKAQLDEACNALAEAGLVHTRPKPGRWQRRLYA
jgi:hypothetical protein